MNTKLSDNQRIALKSLGEKGGVFIAILMFNVSTLLLLSGMVIVPGFIQNVVPPPHEFITKVTPPPPPKPPSKSGGRGSDNHLDPDTLVQPPPMNSPSIVSSLSSNVFSHFAVDPPALPNMSIPSLLPPSGQSESQVHEAQGEIELGDSLLGVSQSQGSPMFTGSLYDFKQDPNHHPTGCDKGSFHATLCEFVTHDWSEDILGKYYKTSKPLFTPQIYIPPVQPSLIVGKLGVKNEISQRMWIAYYKATVVPTEDGEYQFYGTSSDVLAVRIQGKTVLDGGVENVTGLKEDSFRYNVPCDARRFSGKLEKGIPFTVSAGIPINLEIIIGENDGGWFDSFLLLGKVGTTYQTGADGLPEIPVFQVTPAKLPLKGAQLEVGSPVVWPARPDR